MAHDAEKILIHSLQWTYLRIHNKQIRIQRYTELIINTNLQESLRIEEYNLLILVVIIRHVTDQDLFLQKNEWIEIIRSGGYKYTNS